MVVHLTDKTNRQYGTWPSPISSRMVAEGLRLNDAQWDTDSETLVWSEGAGLLMAQQGVDAPIQLNDESLPARGRVGYGGGGFAVAGGKVYFAGGGRRLYRVPVTGGKATSLTPSFGGLASPAVSADGQWVVYVHTYEGRDSLGVVDAAGNHWPRKLVSDSDFLMQPVWQPDGKALAYIAWDHPQMPWDGTRLQLASIDYDATGMPYISAVETVVGDTDTSIFQPMFSPDGQYLAYVSDASGYWQLYIYDLQAKTHTQITTADAEHGIPAWIQGMRTYAWSPEGQNIVFMRNTNGFYSLHRYSVTNGVEAQVDGLNDYTHFSRIDVSPSGVVALGASSTTIPERIITLGTSQVRVYQRSSKAHLDPNQLSVGQAISWQGDDGEDVYGLYYPPTSDRFTGSGSPPLIVDIHGGPTSQVPASYEAKAQFFATRGYGFLFVNHRGSTGYGRAYMKKLRGTWGVYDVEDAASGAQHLVAQGMADPDKLVIIGGSAGGYTVLQSMVRKPGFYAAGICRYGISNLFMLAQETHKFELRYTDSLVGPLPEAADIYRERSPLFNAEKMRDPLLIFQGSEDEVVPQNQSDSIVAALRARGVPHEYHVYEGEGHGFRKPENVRHYYETILKFLNQYVVYA